MTPTQRLTILLCLLTLALTVPTLWHLAPHWGYGMPQWVRLGTLGALIPFLIALAVLGERLEWALRNRRNA